VSPAKTTNGDPERAATVSAVMICVNIRPTGYRRHADIAGRARGPFRHGDGGMLMARVDDPHS